MVTWYKLISQINLDWKLEEGLLTKQWVKEIQIVGCCRVRLFVVAMLV